MTQSSPWNYSTKTWGRNSNAMTAACERKILVFMRAIEGQNSWNHGTFHFVNRGGAGVGERSQMDIVSMFIQD
ncbi:hypothetical protein ABKN59_001807 [Abortiporus biennis]